MSKEKKAKLPAPKDRLRIEYMALTEIAKWPRNPKEHDLGALGESFKRFGFVAPLIIDERTVRLVAGHGRLEELEKLKASNATLPDRIREKNGEWFVPVMRGIRFDNDHDANAYVIADNQHTIAGGWKAEELAACLKDLDRLDGTGFNPNALKKLLRQSEPKNVANQEVPSQFLVIIECKDEKQQAEVIERLMKEGLECRSLVS